MTSGRSQMLSTDNFSTGGFALLVVRSS